MWSFHARALLLFIMSLILGLTGSMKCALTDVCYSASDLEWKLIYVGSAEDETYDQLLESVLVGPVNVGNYRFVFEVLIQASLSSCICIYT